MMVSFIDAHGVDGVDALPTASLCQSGGVSDRDIGERP